MTPTPSPSEYPPPPSVDYPPPLDPDCLAGKHHACLGSAWDYELDDEVSCQCGCHEVALRPTTENVVESL